jgi:hypothetical protein
MTNDCYLEITEESLCTTTTTTICPCDGDEITVSSSSNYNIQGGGDSPGDTWGTYCGVEDERYVAQTFTLTEPGMITRIGIYGWDAVGSPDITLECMLLDIKVPDYGGRPGCDTVSPASYPGFNVESSTNTIRFSGTAPESPEWYYFCFDNVCLSAGQWSFALVFTDQSTHDGSNYVRFCTGSGYSGGNLAYKITSETSNPYGTPLVDYDLSCKVCYETGPSCTSTTTTIAPTTTTTTTIP